MNKHEKKIRERIVRGMKRDLKDFRARYGTDAKQVMYATATKLSQDEVQEDVTSSIKKTKFFARSRSAIKKAQKTYGATKTKASTSKDFVARSVKSAAKKIADRGRFHEQTVVYVKKSILEGSARGGYARRGDYANKADHEKRADSTEASRGIVRSPTTDARKYVRTHDAPYNKGGSAAKKDAEKSKAAEHNKEKSTEKLPVNTSNVSSRISDIMNHPHYKKLASKSK